MALSLRLSGGPSEVRSGDRLCYALIGAKVIAAPGRVIDPGVVVIRGGVFEAVGAQGQVLIPADARVLELKGKFLHAAFIDPCVPAATSPTPAAPANPAHPEDRVIDTLRIQERVADTYRRLGFAVVAADPSSGILRGRGALVSLADQPMEARVLASETGQYVSLEPERFDFANFFRASYPSSRMGAVAMVRQGLLDAAWQRDAEAAALEKAAEGKEPAVFEATDVLSLLRAGKIAQEFKLKARYVGAGDEYRLRDQVVAMHPDLILKVDFPRPYRLDDDTEWLDVPLERLRRMDRAPSNPKWLKDAGLTFSFTTAGLDDPEDFHRRVREALARGLSKDDALAAVTTVPARQLGFGDRLGTIEAGKIADLAVETGEPFAEGSRVTEIWIDGKRHELPERKRQEGHGGVELPPHPAPAESPTRQSRYGDGALEERRRRERESSRMCGHFPVPRRDRSLSPGR
jgi:imidazolonepropionase-like amidohydrolase